MSDPLQDWKQGFDDGIQVVLNMITELTHQNFKTTAELIEWIREQEHKNEL